MKNDDVPVRVELQDRNIKDLGGSEVEAWNDRIMRMVLSAMPMDHQDKVEAGKVGTAVFSGMLDLKAEDPIEGMLIAQLVIAHEGAMAMYQKAWAQPSEYFEARTKYLQLADKAQRTVVMLTERLDHHRGRGQQQITVKHVTVNADNAIVGNVEHHQGGGSKLKAKDQPMHSDMNEASRCGAKTRSGSFCRSPAMNNGRCRMHGGTSPGAPKGNKNALKHGWYTAEAIAMRQRLAELRRYAKQA
jgi:hypothetical protein